MLALVDEGRWGWEAGASASRTGGTLLTDVLVSISFPGGGGRGARGSAGWPGRWETALNRASDESFQLHAGLLAVVLPGLGHAALGKTRRGVLIAVGVLGLFFGGVLIGGVDVVDSREDRWWFIGQSLVGPTAFAVNWANHSLSGSDPGPTAGPGWMSSSPPSRMKSIAHSNEMGMLFATIAGMLNLIAVVDALWAAPAVRRRGGVIGDLEGGRR